MIKFLPLLFVFSLTYGNTIDYLLPDSGAVFSHTLEGILKHSRSEILIISPSFNHVSLKRASLEAVKRGSHLTLIVQSLKGDPLSVAQYERVDVRTLIGRPLEGSIIIIDNQQVCTFSASIDSESFIQNTSIVHCSDDAVELRSLQTIFLPLIKRSKAYLE
ncbi:hypothetical protein [Sulfuricurvum sp.]|uniref:hypothetical protein n=1 Tax=Sulfuricurvum sp. TaxID=2025608 RepID=UPI003563804C